MTIARHNGLSFLVSTAALGVAFLACSSSPRTIEEPPPQEFDHDAGVDDATMQECNQVRCSPDLKKILRTCQGVDEVVTECGAGLGCGDGECVPACDSAERSKGSIGCSFWTLPPEESQLGRGSCFVAMITNTWDGPVNISAELGKDPLDISKSVYTAEKIGQNVVYTPLTTPLESGKVALVFLAQGPGLSETDEFIACPPGIVPALKEDPLRHGTTLTRAFHVKTDAPVSAYSIFPYGGALSHMPAATLLLPVSSWDTNYVGVTGGTISMTGGGYPEVPTKTTLQIIADEDDTEVRMRASADISDGTDVLGTAAGYSQSWKLSRGQVLQFSQLKDLSGSAIETSKRVGVFGGTQCTNLPSSYSACDLLQQQMPGLSRWGNEYTLVSYPSRIPSVLGQEVPESVPWRIVGAVDDTRLTYEPARPAGAPETLAAGQVAVFWSATPVVVRTQDAQHPLYAGLYMTGSSYNGLITAGGNTQQTETTGDPDYVNVVPADQFLDRYVFFADYTYPETTATIVRRKTVNGFRPVELACAGEISDFRPLGTSGQYEYAWVRITGAGVPKVFPKGQCGYGRHEAKSEGPFSITVWGTGEYASYGFAGGMGSRPLHDVKVAVPR
ncbi:hypothetical protein AKJ09_07090 [Labilithrix luteola]|uniref:IgGFc-binding protein N-terminal domain-containing protein n=1 Tax=Labilithrix luteola TaxID=1391654 RepID=A0A0K1Q456_9BACT|nr:IgGFc-binding protein [Labilithrix luteola]AKV00427.1 hypothetical protein AKJ09_07090 [Labilithrix luteola]